MCLMTRIIVHAKNEKEALKKGKEALNKIAEETGGAIYITFDSKELLDDWEVARKNLPPVLLASSFKGTQLIAEGWQLMVDIFMRAFERIKLAIEYLTPEQIMEEVFAENLSKKIRAKIGPSCIREDFLEVGGEKKGTFKFLYFESCPITSRGDLESALNPEAGLKAYVIPATSPW